jgi:hypothetical protein
MPDFLVETDKAINGSKILLLECKGSVRATAHQSQLNTACNKQLANVASIWGSPTTIPRVAVAACLSPGASAEVHVSDPPEAVDTPADLSRLLRANWLALEYELFGDTSSANAVWANNGMRGWARDEGSSSAPPLLQWTASTRQTLRQSKKLIPTSDVAHQRSSFPARDVNVAVEIVGSPRAHAIRDEQAWTDIHRGIPALQDNLTAFASDAETESGALIAEDIGTFTGLRLRQRLTLAIRS